jgi:hypothetical protein
VGASLRGHGLCISGCSNALNTGVAIGVSRKKTRGATSAWPSGAALCEGGMRHADVWKRLSSAGVGFCAPVPVCDQAISHRRERADTGMSGCVERVRTWLRSRREPWEDHQRVRLPTEMVAADARTLDRLGRYVPC